MNVAIPHRNKGTQVMIIDEEDFDKIKDLNITLNHTSNPKTYYAKATIYKDCKYVKTINIHRLIMGLDDYKKDKRIVNHIDGNGLNNRKENLEICDSLYNAQTINKPNSTFAKVYFEANTEKTKRKKQWRFLIHINKKRHSKRFLTEEEANEYRADFIKELYFNKSLSTFAAAPPPTAE